MTVQFPEIAIRWHNLDISMCDNLNGCLSDSKIVQLFQERLQPWESPRHSS